MARAAAILIRDGHLALLERRRGDEHYYLFPGGQVEEGEAPENATIREVREELGLHIAIRQLIAEVRYRGNLQHFFLADIIGTSREMHSDVPPEAGPQVPVWLPCADLMQQPIHPRGLVALIVQALESGWPSAPVSFEDEGRADRRD